MPDAQLAKIDNDLSAEIYFSFKGNQALANEYGSWSRDRKTKQVINFQFPPKWTSDNKSGTWNEAQLFGHESLNFASGTKSREVGMEWTYIAGATPSWPAGRVKYNIDRLKQYYYYNKSPGKYQLKSHNNYYAELILYMKIWGLGGLDVQRFLITNVDITYGKTLVNGTGFYALGEDTKYTSKPFVFPLLTNVKVGLRLWTTAFAKSPPAGTEADVDNYMHIPREGWF